MPIAAARRSGPPQHGACCSRASHCTLQRYAKSCVKLRWFGGAGRPTCRFSGSLFWTPCATLWTATRSQATGKHARRATWRWRAGGWRTAAPLLVAAWPSPRRLAGGPPEGRRSARCAGWHANCGRERPIGWLSSADAVSAASSRAQSARRASRGTEPQTPLSGARRAARRRRRARCARGPVQDVNGLQRGHAAEQKKRARRHGSLVRFSQFFMRQNRVRQRTARGVALK